MSPLFLGFDPGRDKCGVAVVGGDGAPLYREVISAADVEATLLSLCDRFAIATVVMGDRTTAKTWRAKLARILPPAVEIVLVDERNSTLEARDRYWQLHPPRGLSRLIPKGMRLPPRPVDDIVAILLVERFLDRAR